MLILIIYWRFRERGTPQSGTAALGPLQTMMLLNCWILGDDINNVFQVEMQDNATTFTLKHAIKKDGGRALRDVGAGDLHVSLVSKVRHISTFIDLWRYICSSEFPSHKKKCVTHLGVSVGMRKSRTRSSWAPWRPCPTASLNF